MSTALDTFVNLALWASDEPLNIQAQAALDPSFQRGKLVLAAPAFCERSASAGRIKAFLSSFLPDSGIPLT